ncbi:MAG: PQQ-dependent sugar dehydrogenase [Nitrospiraceae bacterium]
MALVLGLLPYLTFAGCGGGDSASGPLQPNNSAPTVGQNSTTPTAPSATSGKPTVTVSGPLSNQTVPSGPVTVALTTSDFHVGGQGQPFVRVYLDADPTPYYLYNAPTNQVHYQGVQAGEVHWVGVNQLRFTSLSLGQHLIHVELVDANGNRLTNPESRTSTVFSVGVAASAVPQIIPDRPGQASSVNRGVTPVSFVVLNHKIGLPGQPHLQFFVNDDPTPHQFYDGPGIDDENGVLLNGLHTHAIHWKSSSSFEMYGWDAGEYRLRFRLVDGQGQALPNPEATATRTFTIVEVPRGEARLQPMISGVPTIAMAFAHDGRLFVSEGKSGNISIVDTTGATWQKRQVPFYHVDVAQAVEQGTFGIALDPAFATNGFVYLHFSVAGGAKNKVIRVKDVGGVGTQETTILDNLPAAEIHNGGVIRFGGDGKLYVTTGEITQDNLAQDRTSLGGKILRINSDGSIPADNPIPGSPVYAMGWRNGFGLAVHPATKDLWGTENGPDTNDEVNRIVAGGNYGWPLVGGISRNPAYMDPLLAVNPTVGITGIVGVAATPVYPPAYHNTLLFTNVNDGDIRRLTLGHDYSELVDDTTIYGGGGPLVDLQQGPDGYVYASGFSTIYRLVVNPAQ